MCFFCIILLMNVRWFFYSDCGVCVREVGGGGGCVPILPDIRFGSSISRVVVCSPTPSTRTTGWIRGRVYLYTNLPLDLRVEHIFSNAKSVDIILSVRFSCLVEGLGVDTCCLLYTCLIYRYTALSLYISLSLS